MCGKFTAMASWSEVINFSEAFTSTTIVDRYDRSITFRVMSDPPVIVWDKEAEKRRDVLPRWGFPNRYNWKIPQPIHARSESIETTPASA
jgi:putative SOS response-associated peptidase YedK